MYKVEPFGVIAIVKSRPCTVYGGQYFTICQNWGHIDQLYSDSLDSQKIRELPFRKSSFPQVYVF